MSETNESSTPAPQAGGDDAAKPEAPKPAAAAAAPKPAAPAAAKPAAAAAAKPAKKPAEPLPPPPVLATRRSFLTWGLGAWSIFGLWMAGVGHLFLRFMFPRVLYEPDPKFLAGRKSDFPEVGKVYEEFKEGQGVWLVRLVEGGEDHLVALSTVCTHLGCTPNWLETEGKFKCPCHGSGFYMTGINFEGPAPRPLERYRLFQDAGGNIIVDRGTKFREDLAQWGSPGSFLKMG